MKKVLLVILVVIIMAIIGMYFLLSHFVGAGTIGSIQAYRFNNKKSDLDSLLIDIANNNNYISSINGNDYFDTLGYEDPRMEEFRSFYTRFEYLSIKLEEESIFRYNTLELDSTRSKLILVSAAQFGESIQFESDLGFFERNSYRNIFKDEIVNKLLRNEIIIEMK